MWGALGLALLLVLLSGCAEKVTSGEIELGEITHTEQEETKLFFYGFKADAFNLLAIEDSIHGFLKENPSLNIIYEGVKGTPYWNALKKRAAAGMLDDVFMVDHDSKLALAEDGALADLSDLPTIDNFLKLARGQFMEEDGSVYFLPTCISTYGLYVNEDMLKADGLDTPENMEAFEAVCDEYVSRGITPIIANSTTTLRTIIVARGMFELYQSSDSQAEIERINAGETDLAELLRPGFELVEKMLSRGWIDGEEALATEATAEDLQLFAQGERPFMMTGGWASQRVAAMNPDFSYTVRPYPIMADGGVLVIDANTCVSVNAQGEHMEEAKAFVEYLTRPNVIWEFCDSQSSFSPLLEKRVLSDKSLIPSVECMESGRCVIGSDYRLTMPLDTCLTECSVQMLRGMGAQEAACTFKQMLANITAE